MTAPTPPYASELWPGGLRADGTGTRVYLPVVREGAVRALVPMDVPRVTRNAVRNASAPQTRRQYAQRVVAGAGLGAGAWLGALVPVARTAGAAFVSTADDLLEQEMAARAGVGAASMAVHFGPPRANLKPVAKIYDSRTGRACAVVKFGCSPLTGELVAREAQALRALQRLRDPALEVPTLLHEGAWGASTYVMQSVVRFGGRHRLPSAVRLAAAEDAVVSTGTPLEGPLRTSSYREDLLERVLGLDDDPVSGAVAAAGRQLLDVLGDEPVRTGGWHGDWAPQNVCATASGVGAWDWERWAPDRPRGYDTLHFRAQELLAAAAAGTSDAGTVGSDLLDSAPSLLARHQPGLDAQGARRLAALYLVDIGHRYLTDGQRDTPSMAGRMDTWLVPALATLTRRDRAGDERT